MAADFDTLDMRIQDNTREVIATFDPLRTMTPELVTVQTLIGPHVEDAKKQFGYIDEHDLAGNDPGAIEDKLNQAVLAAAANQRFRR